MKAHAMYISRCMFSTPVNNYTVKYTTKVQSSCKQRA